MRLVVLAVLAVLALIAFCVAVAATLLVSNATGT